MFLLKNRLKDIFDFNSFYLIKVIATDRFTPQSLIVKDIEINLTKLKIWKICIFSVTILLNTIITCIMTWFFVRRYQLYLIENIKSMIVACLMTWNCVRWHQLYLKEKNIVIIIACTMTWNCERWHQLYLIEKKISECVVCNLKALLSFLFFGYCKSIHLYGNLTILKDKLHIEYKKRRWGMIASETTLHKRTNYTAIGHHTNKTNDQSPYRIVSEVFSLRCLIFFK